MPRSLVPSLAALAIQLTVAAGAPSAKPILGYNTYNAVSCTLNSTWTESTINAMAASGLVELGYTMFQIDCGWQGLERLNNGSITYDADAFPDGVHPVADLVRSKGMTWAMYTDQGVYACDTRTAEEGLRPGSLGYELEDAAMFAAWGVEYVKVDNCYIEGAEDNAPKRPRTDFVSRFTTMWDALIAFDILEMLICQWGTPYINASVTPATYTNTTAVYAAERGSGSLQGPAEWTPPISTSYRMSDDIATGWDDVLRIMNEAIHINLRGLSGPGNWADMDLLEVGNPGMTIAEQRSHFGSWAAFKSALFVSTDLMDISEDTLAILGNKDVIAINQDDAGEPVKLVQRFNGEEAYDVYAGGLQDGNMAVLLVDHSNTTRTLSIDFELLGIHSADIKELWTGATVPKAGNFSMAVDAHGCMLLRLSNIQPGPVIDYAFTFYEAEAGTLAGSASAQDCITCSGGSKIGNIDNSSSLTFTSIKTSQETSDVLFDYINCDIRYTFADKGSNARGAVVSVNGAEGVEVQFPVTGYDWERDVLEGFKVRLSGFDVKGENSIEVTGGELGFAPDLDRIAVVT